MTTRAPVSLDPPRGARLRGDDAETWWNALEEDVLECLARNGALSAVEIGRLLGFSEATATSLTSMLASQGRVRIGRIELVGPASRSVAAVVGKAA